MYSTELEGMREEENTFLGIDKNRRTWTNMNESIKALPTYIKKIRGPVGLCNMKRCGAAS